VTGAWRRKSGASRALPITIVGAVIVEVGAESRASLLAVSRRTACRAADTLRAPRGRRWLEAMATLGASTAHSRSVDPIPTSRRGSRSRSVDSIPTSRRGSRSRRAVRHRTAAHWIKIRAIGGSLIGRR